MLQKTLQAYMHLETLHVYGREDLQKCHFSSKLVYGVNIILIKVPTEFLI